jgi:AhpD family alkylhydroperoxidase
MGSLSNALNTDSSELESKCLLVGEVVKHRLPSHVGRLGDVVHCRPGDTALVKQPIGRVKKRIVDRPPFALAAPHLQNVVHRCSIPKHVLSTPVNLVLRNHMHIWSVTVSDMPTVEEWEAERERLNAVVLDNANLNVRRFFALDHQAYVDGALSANVKELLGLVASLVLRCDDCITYHVIRCREEGVTSEEVVEAMNVGLVVGGSIVIPHLRRAMERWQEVQARTDVSSSAAAPHSGH